MVCTSRTRLQVQFRRIANIFSKRVMCLMLEEHAGKVSVGGRNITNLRFADDIDALAEEELEVEALVTSLD